MTHRAPLRALTLSITSSLAALATSFALSGCSVAHEDEAATSAQAYTVPDGDRFVVRASASEIVLLKSVDAAPFPFAPEEIVGKAVLVHPVAGKAESGAYLRATEVDDLGPTYRVRGRVMPLVEMSELVEDEIIRIYLDRRLASGARRPAARTATLTPLGTAADAVGDFPWTGTLEAQSWGGLLSGDLNARGWIATGPTRRVEGTARGWIEDAGITAQPEGRFAYHSGRGLEVGARLDADFHATVGFSGRLQERTRIFESPRISSPRTVVAVPIGPVPVPVTLGLTARIACDSVTRGTVEGAATLRARLSVGGSWILDPKRVGQPGWIAPGEWTPHADASASLSVDELEFVGDAGISCDVPRVDLETLVAGVAGPYLSFVPTYALTTQRGSLRFALRAGVKGRLFNRESAAEVELLSYEP